MCGIFIYTSKVQVYTSVHMCTYVYVLHTVLHTSVHTYTPALQCTDRQMSVILYVYWYSIGKTLPEMLYSVKRDTITRNLMVSFTVSFRCYLRKMNPFLADIFTSIFHKCSLLAVEPKLILHISTPVIYIYQGTQRYFLIQLLSYFSY